MRWPWVSRSRLDAAEVELARHQDRIDRIEFHIWDHTEPDIPLGQRLRKLPKRADPAAPGHLADHQLVNEALHALTDRGLFGE